MDQADSFRGDSENLGSDLCHRGVGALPHVYRTAANSAASVSVDVDHRNGCGWRHARFDSDWDAAAAANRARTALEWTIPFEPFGQPIENRIDIDVAHDHSRCVRPAFPQDVSPAKLQGIDPQRLSDHVHLRFISPDYL